MAATIPSSLDVEDALLRVGESLGMKVMLLRMVAAELPDHAWLHDVELERDGSATIARARHLCGASCAIEAKGCLTAFKVEAAVTKRRGEVMAISALARDGPHHVRVTLWPLARPAGT